jgi:hypothetical protein
MHADVMQAPAAERHQLPLECSQRVHDRRDRAHPTRRTRTHWRSPIQVALNTTLRHPTL